MLDSQVSWGRLNIRAELSLPQDCGTLLSRIIVVLLIQEKLNLYPPGSHKVNFLLCHAWCFMSFIRSNDIVLKGTDWTSAKHKKFIERWK